MQLGTCAVIIKFKTVKKMMCVFAVPGKGQGMPDTAVLNIINPNTSSGPNIMVSNPLLIISSIAEFHLSFNLSIIVLSVFLSSLALISHL